LVFQIGANANQTAKVSVDKATSDQLGTGVSGLATGVTNLSLIDITSFNGAQDSIKIVDQAINQISSLRGKLGAFQSQTLESMSNNLRSTLENTVAAESVIRDTDFAHETANYTKFQVLMQVGASVLSNANSTSQLVLSLLQR
jgi:flagellin